VTKGRQQLSDAERRAIVWDTVERMAFRPQKPKRWIGVFKRTLHTLWKVEPFPWENGKFALPIPDLECRYHAETVEKYNSQLVRHSVNATVWRIEVDPEYLSRAALHDASGKYPHQARQSRLRRDVELVLDGMLFHPRNHTHLSELGIGVPERPDLRPADRSRKLEVRIGGGIENSFIFLFHLRYQFCLISEVRKEERRRLVELFTNAISVNRPTVTARDLFDFRY
jgi:hypothetical protein